MPPLPLITALAVVWVATADAPASPVPPRRPPSPSAAAREEAIVRFKAGRDALDAKNWGEAEAEFRVSARLAPGLAVAHYGIGQALMGQARYPEAADAFLACRNAFAVASKKGESYARTTEVRDLRDTLQALAGRHALTADRFLEMELEKRLAELQKWAGPPVAWAPPGVTMALGTAFFHAGAFPEAEQEFLAVLRAIPGSGDAENNLAIVYVAMGRLEEAEAAVARAEKAGVVVSERLKDEIRRRRPSPP
jgi:tetratricopeptide (TPR) repeat protein